MCFKHPSTVLSVLLSWMLSLPVMWDCTGCARTYESQGYHSCHYCLHRALRSACRGARRQTLHPCSVMAASLASAAPSRRSPQAAECAYTRPCPTPAPPRPATCALRHLCTCYVLYAHMHVALPVPHRLRTCRPLQPSKYCFRCEGAGPHEDMTFEITSISALIPSVGKRR